MRELPKIPLPPLVQVRQAIQIATPGLIPCHGGFIYTTFEEKHLMGLDGCARICWVPVAVPAEVTRRYIAGQFPSVLAPLAKAVAELLARAADPARARGASRRVGPCPMYWRSASCFPAARK